MILNKLNGEQFKELVINGAKNLRLNIEEVDSLNVFPVPDGDTGTNMSRTIEGGINAVSNKEEKNYFSSNSASITSSSFLSSLLDVSSLLSLLSLF